MRPQDHDAGPMPPTVVAAAAFGTAPVPFVAIYAVLFLVHGSVHPVVPPDITGSQRGELFAGIVAGLVFGVSVTALLWVVNGRRRWLFALVQAAMLGSASSFLVDGTKGGAAASVLVVFTAGAALVLILAPPSQPFYGHGGPRPGDRAGRVRSRRRGGETRGISGRAPTLFTANTHGRPKPVAQDEHSANQD